MLKSFTIVSLVAATAWAQSSTLIPSGISQGCTDFLTQLNSNSDISKCTTALSGALSAFQPGANGTASAASVKSALTNLCGDDITAACPTTTLATQITQFSVSCAAELASNADVGKLYDVLYGVQPFRSALCTKDDSGSWCVASAKPADGTSAETVQNALFTQNGADVVPNTQTFNQYGLPFLFLSPSSPNLCQTCTRNILNAYIQYESGLPNAVGLGKSTLLGQQSALFEAVKAKCGADFMVSEVKAASGLGNSFNPFGSSSGALPIASAGLHSLVAAAAGFATLAIAAF